MLGMLHAMGECDGCQRPTMSKCRPPAGNNTSQPSQPEGRIEVSPVTPTQQRFFVSHRAPLPVQDSGKRGWPTGKADGHWRASPAAQTDRAAGWLEAMHHITLDTWWLCVLWSVFCILCLILLQSYEELCSILYSARERAGKYPPAPLGVWDSGSSGHRTGRHGAIARIATWKEAKAGQRQGLRGLEAACVSCAGHQTARTGAVAMPSPAPPEEGSLCRQSRAPLHFFPVDCGTPGTPWPSQPRRPPLFGTVAPAAWLTGTLGTTRACRGLWCPKWPVAFETSVRPPSQSGAVTQSLRDERGDAETPQDKGSPPALCRRPFYSTSSTTASRL